MFYVFVGLPKETKTHKFKATNKNNKKQNKTKKHTHTPHTHTHNAWKWAKCEKLLAQKLPVLQNASWKLILEFELF